MLDTIYSLVVHDYDHLWPFDFRRSRRVKFVYCMIPRRSQSLVEPTSISPWSSTAPKRWWHSVTSLLLLNSPTTCTTLRCCCICASMLRPSNCCHTYTSRSVILRFVYKANNRTSYFFYIYQQGEICLGEPLTKLSRHTKHFYLFSFIFCHWGLWQPLEPYGKTLWNFASTLIQPVGRSWRYFHAVCEDSQPSRS